MYCEIQDNHNSCLIIDDLQDLNCFFHNFWNYALILRREKTTSYGECGFSIYTSVILNHFDVIIKKRTH